MVSTVRIIAFVLFVIVTLSLAVFLPLYFFKWKSDSKTEIPSDAGAISIYQIQLSPYFCKQFFSSAPLATDETGMCFTLSKLPSNDANVPYDLTMTSIDGVVTNRSLQEITGGTLNAFRFAPYFNSLYENVGIATDKQIQAYLSSGGKIDKSNTDSDGSFYLKTGADLTPTSLNLGRLVGTQIVPFIRTNASDTLHLPSSVCIFADPKLTITDMIFTSYYNIHYGPAVYPIESHSKEFKHVFLYQVPLLFFSNLRTGKKPIPQSSITSALKPGMIPVPLADASKLFTKANDPRVGFFEKPTEMYFHVLSHDSGGNVSFTLYHYENFTLSPASESDSDNPSLFPFILLMTAQGIPLNTQVMDLGAVLGTYSSTAQKPARPLERPDSDATVPPIPSISPTTGIQVTKVFTKDSTFLEKNKFSITISSAVAGATVMSSVLLYFLILRKK